PVDYDQLGLIHNPPEGGSSVFKKEYVNYIFDHLPKKEIREIGKSVTVVLGLVDTGSLPTDRFILEDIDPLVVDWARVKLSKSILVRGGVVQREKDSKLEQSITITSDIQVGERNLD
ncbi:21105_t:CDS:2, partial [Rhizophagus irregularis]